MALFYSLTQESLSRLKIVSVFEILRWKIRRSPSCNYLRNENLQMRNEILRTNSFLVVTLISCFKVGNWNFDRLSKLIFWIVFIMEQKCLYRNTQFINAKNGTDISKHKITILLTLLFDIIPTLSHKYLHYKLNS